MLYIKFASAPSTSWHVGEPAPMMLGEVLEVQADGDELSHILCNSTGLPVATRTVSNQTGPRRVQIWHGDFAKFIVANMIP